MPLHNHLLLNGYCTNQQALLDIDGTKQWMADLVDQIGMKLVQGPFVSYVNKDGNRGLTAACMIETSHIGMHIWDEQYPAFMQFDLYTCSTLPVEQVIANLTEKWGLIDYTHLVLERSDGFVIAGGSKRASD